MNCKIIIPVLAALAVASCGSRGGDQQPQGPGFPGAQADVTPTVEVITASSRDVAQESTYSSSVEAYATNNIMPQTGARIRKINVEVGDYVTKGQVLAEMDRLQLEQLELQIQNDEIEYARLKGLYEEGGVSQSDFEAAELGYKVRKTNYQNLLENTILRSPINGFVTARNFDVGDMFAMSAEGRHRLHHRGRPSGPHLHRPGEPPVSDHQRRHPYLQRGSGRPERRPRPAAGHVRPRDRELRHPPPHRTA